MKTISVITVILLIMMAFSSPDRGHHPADLNIRDSLANYQDGTWEGQSRAMYTDEPYWGKVRVKIKKGKPVRVSFMIRDSALHETFTDQYKVHFKDNAEYMQ